MEVLKRLLYKEWRESWVVVVVFLTAPAFVIPLGHYLTAVYGKYKEYDGYVLVISAAFVYLWAATKANDAQSRRVDPLSVIPVRPFAGWLVSTFPSPLLVFAAGYWLFSWIHGESAYRYILPLPHAVWLSASYFAALVIGRAVSKWVGSFYGVLISLYAMVGEGVGGRIVLDRSMLAAAVALALSALMLVLRKKRRQVQARIAIAFVTVVPIVIFVTSVVPRDIRPRPDITEVINDVCVVSRSWENAPKGKAALPRR